MAYKYEGSARTSTGKIIYRRKPHLFNACDLARIAEVVELPETDYGMLCFIVTLLRLLGRIRDERDYDVGNKARDLEAVLWLWRADFEPPLGVGGGAGGAGATGTFAGERPRWWLGKWP